MPEPSDLPVTPDVSVEMLQALTLQDAGARTTEDIFTAPSQWMPHGRVYGGQVLAQSALAAMRTVDAERPIHSMHAYFLHPGDLDETITFSVDRIHDGRSFSTRRTQAYQSGLPILSMIASFQTVDEGLDHSVPMPSGLPGPEQLETVQTISGLVMTPVERRRPVPFDVRMVPAAFLPEGVEAHWFRATVPLGDDPAFHKAAMLYASDYELLHPVLSAHGLGWMEPGLRVASLDHAMWWHRPGRADEWLLYVRESPNAVGGRGLAYGRIFSGDGRLLASVSQEGMVRVPRPSVE